MNEIVYPTPANCQQLCKQAYTKWLNVLKNCNQNELEIINWRLQYSLLNDFETPIEQQKNVDIQRFKQAFALSAELFYKLLEEKEAANTTERVEISMWHTTNEQLKYAIITAVAPKNSDNINTSSIKKALNNLDYQAFYIEDKNFVFDLKLKEAFAYYIGTDNRLYPINKYPPLRIGILIINPALYQDYYSYFNEKSARIDIVRI